MLVKAPQPKPRTLITFRGTKKDLVKHLNAFEGSFSSKKSICLNK